MTFGEKIRTLRNAKNMSQPEFAALVGIEQSYLSKLENDKSVPSNDIFRALLNALGLTVPELLNDTELASDKERLRQIPDVDNWISQRRQRRASTQRLFLYVSAVLITLASCCFYAGTTKQLFAETSYRYFSHGVILDDESDGIYQNWRDLLDRNTENYRVLHETRRLEMEKRKSPEYHQTFDYMGESFTLSEGKGRRVFVFDGESAHPRRVNAVLQVVGVGLFVMGLLGFLLERRLASLQA